MIEDAVQKYYKFIRPEMYDVLKQNYKIVKMFLVLSINVNKATIIIYDTVAPSNTIDNDSMYSLQSIRKLGDKMILPIGMDCIDSVINLYGDVAACMFVKEGVIIGMISFEELNIASVEQANNFISGMIRKK